jgi:hypothetical protein
MYYVDGLPRLRGVNVESEAPLPFRVNVESEAPLPFRVNVESEAPLPFRVNVESEAPLPFRVNVESEAPLPFRVMQIVTWCGTLVTHEQWRSHEFARHSMSLGMQTAST